MDDCTRPRSRLTRLVDDHGRACSPPTAARGTASRRSTRCGRSSSRRPTRCSTRSPRGDVAGPLRGARRPADAGRLPRRDPARREGRVRHRRRRATHLRQARPPPPARVRRRRRVSRPAEQVLAQWEEIKAAEKAAKGARTDRMLDGVKPGPALARAQKLGSKAGKVGFDWPGWQGSFDEDRARRSDEVREADAAGDAAQIHARLATCCSRSSTSRASSASTPRTRSSTRPRVPAPLRVRRGPAEGARQDAAAVEPRGDGRAVERREGRRREVRRRLLREVSASAHKLTALLCRHDRVE